MLRAIWSAVRQILTGMFTLLSLLGDLKREFAKFRVEQLEQRKLLEQILAEVKPAPPVKFNLTLSPIPTSTSIQGENQ